MMAKIELELSNKFLDKQTMSELECKFWKWLERYEIYQGDLEEKQLKIKIIVEGKYFYDSKLNKNIED